jgi:hypothetical protein
MEDQMNLPGEMQQQEAHDKRIREDLDYAIQCKEREVYWDLRSFQEFMEEHEIMPLIASQLMRAICNTPMASRNGGPSGELNDRILRARLAVVDSMAEVKNEIDRKIIESVERAR